MDVKGLSWSEAWSITERYLLYRNIYLENAWL